MFLLEHSVSNLCSLVAGSCVTQEDKLTLSLQVSRILEALRLGVKFIVSPWNLTGASAAMLLRRLSNFQATGQLQNHISLLRDFARSDSKTPYHFVNKGLDWVNANTFVLYILSIYSRNGLSNWSRVMHICVSKLNIIGSDIGLSSGQRQAIISTNAGISLVSLLGTNRNFNRN